MNLVEPILARAEKYPTRLWMFFGSAIFLPIALYLSVQISLAIGTIAPVIGAYPFRQGNLALTGSTKSGDIIFAAAFVVLLSIAGLATSSIMKRVTDRRVVIVEVLLLSFPAITLLVAQIFSRATPILPAESAPLASISLAQASMILYAILRRTMGLGPMSWQRVAVQTFLAGMLPISVSGILLAGAYISPTMRQSGLSIPIYLTALFVAVFALAISSRASIRNPNVRDVLQSFVITITAAASLLPPIVDAAVVAGVRPLSWAIVLILIAAVVGIEAYFRHCRTLRPRLTILSSTIAIYVVSIRSQFLPPRIDSDNYHFGELITPHFLWSRFGQVPYVDIDLPRGLLANVLPQAANTLVNSGQASTFDYVQPLVLLCVVFFAHLVFRNLFGTIFASLMVFPLSITTSLSEGDLFTLTILMLVSAAVIRRASFGLPGLAFAIGSVVAILAYPLMGFVTFGIASLVFAAGLFATKDMARRGKYVALNLGIASTLLMATLLSPVGPLLLGAFEYLLSNARANSDAFGVSYILTWIGATGIDWIFGTLFLAAVPVSALLVSRILRSQGASKVSPLNLAFAVSPAFFAIALAGRFLGRIDPVTWSFRPTLGTIVTLGVVVPAFSILAIPRIGRRIALLSSSATLVMSLAFAPAFVDTNIVSAMGKRESVDMSASASLSGGIPLLGIGQMDQKNVDYLRSIYSDRPDIEPGEYVLNLSNHGTLFSYFGWRNPLRVLAPYNIESTAAELEAISELERLSPRFALLAPATHWDGGSLAQRTPTLANWLLDNYTPFKCGSNIWAIRTDLQQYAVNSNSPAPCGEFVEEGEVAALWQESIGAEAGFSKGPAYWGNSIPTEMRSSLVGLRKVGDFSWSFPPRFSRQSALILESRCLAGSLKSGLDQEADSTASVRFLSDSGEVAAASFVFGEGTFVIPMIGFPILEGMSGIHFELEFSTPGCSEVQVAASLL